MGSFLGRAALLAGAAALFVAVGARTVAAPGGVPTAGRDWFSFGGDDSEQHFSPLTQITDANVKNLGLAWSYDIDTFDAYTAPLAVNGVLYFAAGNSVIHALDARTGKVLWQYDPRVADAPGAQTRMRAGWGIRGIAWRDGKIFTATRDGRLLAVDARDGSTRRPAAISPVRRSSLATRW